MGSETPPSSPIQLPKVDFSGLGPTGSGSSAWATARAQVMDALATCGCFEAVYPKVTPELRSSLMDTSRKQLFSLPLETKLKNHADKPFHGYLGQIPYLAYESLAIMDASSDGAESFARTMWPDGNPKFSETVQDFSKQVAELDEMVMRMVLESLGVGKHLKSKMETTKYLLRMSEYGTPEAEEEGKKLGLIAHRDKITTAIICQNQVDGLEIETKDGVWYPAAPSSDSFIVIAGDAFRAWTNGRVYSPMHRILVGGKVTRYSAILFSVPHDEALIEAPPELVDADRPQLFKPYDYGSYVRFCVTEEGQKANPQLDAFCGLNNKQSEP